MWNICMQDFYIPHHVFYWYVSLGILGCLFVCKTKDVRGEKMEGKMKSVNYVIDTGVVEIGICREYQE